MVGRCLRNPHTERDTTTMARAERIESLRARPTHRPRGSMATQMCDDTGSGRAFERGPDEPDLSRPRILKLGASRTPLSFVELARNCALFGCDHAMINIKPSGEILGARVEGLDLSRPLSPQKFALIL